MNRRIKNKRFNNKKIIGLASLILVGGLVTGCDTILLKKEYEYNRIEFTSDGEFKETRQFKSFDNSDAKGLNNSFTYYGEWEQRKDNKYQRNVKEYDIKDKSYEELNQSIHSNNDIEDFLGKPVKTYTQISNSLSPEDLSKGSYYEVTIYDENKDKYVYVKEESKNTWMLLGAGVLIPVAVGALIGWNKYNESFDDEKKKKLTLKK